MRKQDPKERARNFNEVALGMSEDEAVKEALKVYTELIKLQTNVKEIKFIDSFDQIKYTMKPNYKNIGADFGLATGDVLTKLKSVDEQDLIKGVLAGGFEFDLKANIEGKEKEMHIKLEDRHISLEKHIKEPFTGAEFDKGALYIDPTLTEELENEGYAREVIRRIQQLRKEAKLEKSQKIDLFVGSDSDLHEDIKKLIEVAKDKVGAQKITISTLMPEEGDYEHKKEDKVKNKTFNVMLNLI